MLTGNKREPKTALIHCVLITEVYSSACRSFNTKI